MRRKGRRHLLSGSNDCNTAACKDNVCAVTAVADGKSCTAKDECHAAGTCESGACTDGKALPDGTAFDPANHTACCGGAVVALTSDTNCNVCGLKCIASTHCKPQGASPEEYQCTGCTGGGDCISKCCSDSVKPGTFVCAMSECSMGLCPNPDLCPSGHCQKFVGDKNNFCTY